MNFVRDFAAALLLLSGSLAAQDDPLLELVPPDSLAAEQTLEILPDSTLSGDVDAGNADTLPPLTKMPELTKFVEAVYPEQYMKSGLEGVVLMELLVSDSGRVDSVKVLAGLKPAFDSAAVLAARQFVFSPAQAGVTPVPVLITYEYRFSLSTVARDIVDIVNFSGILLEKGTRTPLADAIVVLSMADTTADTTLPLPFSKYLERIASFGGQSLEEGRLVATTDSLGRFSFHSVPACSLTLSAPIPGYEALAEKECLAAGEKIEATYYLKRVSYNDYEVVVYGKREEKEVEHHQLSITEVRKIPGFGGDAVKVVQALPGVARASFFGGGVVVRGAPTWDSRFYLDGLPIPQLYHFGGVKSTYNSDAIESVNFYPGGFGTRYGNVSAGVIEIAGRSAKTDRIHGKADISMIDGSVFVEGPVTDKVSVLGSVRRSFLGEVIGWGIRNFPKLNIPVNIAPFYWDYQTRVDAKINPDNKVFITAFGSKDELEILVPSSRIGSAEIDAVKNRIYNKNVFHQVHGGWDCRISPVLSNELRLGFTYGLGAAAVLGVLKQDYRSKTFDLRDQLSWTANTHVTLNAGTEIDLMGTDMVLKVPKADNTFVTDSINLKTGIVGAYVNAEIRPVEQLLIIPGLRYDYFPELKYKGSVVPTFWDYNNAKFDKGISGEPSARISARFNLSKDHMLKAALGTYSQTPQPIGFVIDKQFGNPALPATKARHALLGWEWQLTDLISADVQVYNNHRWDIARFVTSKDIAAGTATTFLGDGEARSTGLEVMLRHAQGDRFFGWIAYTLSQSETRDPQSGGWNIFNKDQTNNLQLVASVRLPRNWETGIRARYVTGNPFTPDTGSVYSFMNHQYSPLSGEVFSKRYEPFLGLDLRVEKKFIFRKWLMTGYLDIQNVNYFFYKSPEFRQNNYDFTEESIIPAIFFPALGISGEF